MTITVNSDCNIEEFRLTDAMMKDWGCIKEATKDNHTSIFFNLEKEYKINYILCTITIL